MSDVVYNATLDDRAFQARLKAIERNTNASVGRVGQSINAATANTKKFVGALGGVVGVGTSMLGIFGAVGGLIGAAAAAGVGLHRVMNRQARESERILKSTRETASIVESMRRDARFVGVLDADVADTRQRARDAIAQSVGGSDGNASNFRRIVLALERSGITADRVTPDDVARQARAFYEEFQASGSSAQRLQMGFQSGDFTRTSLGRATTRGGFEAVRQGLLAMEASRSIEQRLRAEHAADERMRLATRSFDMNERFARAGGNEDGADMIRAMGRRDAMLREADDLANRDTDAALRTRLLAFAEYEAAVGQITERIAERERAVQRQTLADERSLAAERIALLALRDDQIGAQRAAEQLRHSEAVAQIEELRQRNAALGDERMRVEQQRHAATMRNIAREASLERARVAERSRDQRLIAMDILAGTLGDTPAAQMLRATAERERTLARIRGLDGLPAPVRALLAAQVSAQPLVPGVGAGGAGGPDRMGIASIGGGVNATSTLRGQALGLGIGSGPSNPAAAPIRAQQANTSATQQLTNTMLQLIGLLRTARSGGGGVPTWG